MMRTFASALREARAAVERTHATMGMTTMQAGGEAGHDAAAARLAELERRIVPAQSAGAVADNPRVRCDYCPRVQQADMMVEVDPGRYACDTCLWRGHIIRPQPE